jgi:hypothetical protein
VGVSKKGEGQTYKDSRIEEEEAKKSVMHAPVPRKGVPAATQDFSRKRQAPKKMQQKIYKQERVQTQTAEQDKIQQQVVSEVDMEKKEVARDESVAPKEQKQVMEQVAKVDASKTEALNEVLKRSDKNRSKGDRKATKAQLSSNESEQAQLQNRLNVAQQQALNFRGYVSQRDIVNMFRESIKLAKMSQKDMDSLWENDLKDGYIKKSESISNQVRPLMNVTNIDKAYYLSPDINWFLSKSEPGTIEHQFFNLARFGWCENRNLCYSDTFKPIIVTGKPVRSKAPARQVAEPPLFGRIDKTQAKDLLSQWQKLYPKLDGVFQQIAQQTIEHLEAIK